MDHRGFFIGEHFGGFPEMFSTFMTKKIDKYGLIIIPILLVLLFSLGYIVANEENDSIFYISAAIVLGMIIWFPIIEMTTKIQVYENGLVWPHFENADYYLTPIRKSVKYSAIIKLQNGTIQKSSDGKGEIP